MYALENMHDKLSLLIYNAYETLFIVRVLLNIVNYVVSIGI